jgi:TRAP transporter TAXI family solute receptor
MVEVEVSRPVRLLSLEIDKMEAFLKKYGGGFTPVTIPAGSYKGQKEPAQTLSTVGFFVAPSSAPDDVIYRIVKALWTNLDRLKNSHVSLAYATKETVGRGMALPLHPGAEKFFRENNIPFDAGTLK